MGRGPHEEVKERMAAVFAILKEQHPCTVRQVFYQSLHLVPNNRSGYRKIAYILGIGRENGQIPWEWICDRSRQIYEHSGWKNLEEYGETMAYGYRRNYWVQQPHRVFILCEKNALIGCLDPVGDEFGCDVFPLSGYGSKTRVRDIGVAVREAAADGKVSHILYCGDFDPSGVDMDRDLAVRIEQGVLDDYSKPDARSTLELRRGRVYNRLPGGWRELATLEREASKIEEAWFDAHPDADGDEDEPDHSEIVFQLACKRLGLDPVTAGLAFHWHRLAILEEDIAKFNLPPQRVKNSDSRAPGFILKHGRNCVEVDSLRPSELRRRLRLAIKALIEPTAWERDMRVEKLERAFTKKTMASFRQMAGGLVPGQDSAG